MGAGVPAKRFEPERVQIVSDLGQLKAFTPPVQARLLRVLQKHEATGIELATIVGERGAMVRQHMHPPCFSLIR